jgi:hypothetical protein
MLWHVDPLLGNDREISNHTTTFTRQGPVNSNRENVFSVLSVLKCKQDKWGLRFSRDLLLLEADS